MGCNSVSNIADLKVANAVESPSELTFNPEEGVYYYDVKPLDPCQDHLKHKRPTNFEFLAIRSIFVNPHTLTNGILLITPKLKVLSDNVIVPLIGNNNSTQTPDMVIEAGMGTLLYSRSRSKRLHCTGSALYFG